MSASISFYSKLSEEEISDPFIVIHSFFDYSDISSVKENMWEWLKITVSGMYCSKLMSKGRRYDMLYLYEHLERFIEAAYIIHRKQQNSKETDDRLETKNETDLSQPGLPAKKDQDR